MFFKFIFPIILLICSSHTSMATSVQGLPISCNQLFPANNSSESSEDLFPEISPQNSEGWILDISDWIMDRFHQGSPKLLPRLSSSDPTEIRLARALERLKADFLQEEGDSSWWEMFSVEIQNILMDSGAVRSPRKSRQDWIFEISDWTREQDRLKLKIQTPRMDAKNPRERKLGRALDRLKQGVKNKKDHGAWWSDFPEDIQSLWKKYGILEKRKRSDKEWIEDISQWVRQAYLQRHHPESSGFFAPRVTAKDYFEKSLGIGLSNHKKKWKEQHSSLPWWTPFPKDVQWIWFQMRVIPAIYADNPAQ